MNSNNYALNMPVTASSTINKTIGQITPNPDRLPKFAVDGNITSTTNWWASEYRDNSGNVGKEIGNDEIFTIDLEEVKEINQVKLYWNTGRAKKYEIQVSTTGNEDDYTTVYLFDDTSNDQANENLKRNDVLEFSHVEARYVRFKGIERTSNYWPIKTNRAGYTLYEIEVYNTLSLRSSISKTNEALTIYTKDKFVHLDDAGYNAIYQPLKAALDKANAFLASGSGYLENDLLQCVNELNGALDNYLKAVIKVQSIETNLTEVNLNKGDIFQLQVMYTPENATLKEVELTSANQNIVIISNDGTIQAVGAGSANIVVRLKDSNIERVVPVHVHVAPQKILLEKNQVTLSKGDVYEIKASVLPQDTTIGKTILYTSSDEAVASVDALGKVSGLKRGEVTITATIKDTNISATMTINVEVDFTAKSGNLALNKLQEASSVVNNSNTQNRLAKFANDGDLSTRWASEYLPEEEKEKWDSGWLEIDLGTIQSINEAMIYWETSKPIKYQLLGSTDKNEYFTLYEFSTDDSSTGDRIDKLEFETKEVRYIKIQGIDRASNYNSSRGGYSIYEFEVYDSKNCFKVIEDTNTLLANYASVDGHEKENVVSKLGALEQVIENELFTSESLYTAISELEKAVTEFKASIIQVESIEVSLIKNSILPNEKTLFEIKVLPENATNKNYKVIVVDETIAKVEGNEIEGLLSGETTIKVVSEDGSVEAETILVVRTNNHPTIKADPITVSLYIEFDPLFKVSANDIEDGELVPTVINNNVDTMALGEYEVEYSVKDSDNNEATVKRIVTVELNQGSITEVTPENGFYVEGVIPTDMKINFVIQSKNQAIIESLSGKFNQTVLAVYDFKLVSKIRGANINGTYQISVPNHSGYTSIKVHYVDGSNQINELNSWQSNNSISFDTNKWGRFVIVGNKYIAPVIPEPEEDVSISTKPINPNKPGNDIIQTPNFDEDGKEEIKKPEYVCDSSDCGENQPVDEEQNQEIISSQTNNGLLIGGVAAIIVMAIGIILFKRRK